MLMAVQVLMAVMAVAVLVDVLIYELLLFLIPVAVFMRTAALPFIVMAVAVAVAEFSYTVARYLPELSR